jgi:hypothetical protein
LNAGEHVEPLHSLRARLRRADGVATPASAAARASRETNLELTFALHQSTGADQFGLLLSLGLMF